LSENESRSKGKAVKNIVFAIILLCAGAYLVGQLKKRKTILMLNDGTVLLNEGEVHDAVAKYEEAVHYNPSHKPARSMLIEGLKRAVQVSSESGELDRVIGYSKRWVELDPNAADAHLEWAYALSRKQEFDEARSHFRKYLDAHPQDRRAKAALQKTQGGSKP